MFSTRIAVEGDALVLHEIINWAYRGGKEKKGWTGEEHLVHGKRMSLESFKDSLNEKDSVYLVLEEKLKDGKKELRGCIKIEKISDHESIIGVFSVDPDHQSRGIGGRLMTDAIKYAIEVNKSTVGIMHVISVRDDLLNWYYKLGFKQTNDPPIKFPTDTSVGVPRQNDLNFKTLKKVLSKL